MPHPPTRRVAAAFPVGVASALLLALAATAAPPYVESGRARELSATGLAEDAGGPVSALDVLFYMDASRRAGPRDAALWIARGGEDPAAKEELRAATLEYLAVRSLARAATGGEAESPRRAELIRAMAHPGAQAAWIEVAVEPEVKVEETDVQGYYLAHPEIYAAPDRAQVRYIFLSVNDLTEPGRLREAQIELESVRARVAGGEIDFAEAARLHSEAPSGVEGGLIPPFSRGETFKEFEYYAFAIDEPGRMSPVFAGVDGVYLLQLVWVERGREISFPEVRESIAAHLKTAHVAEYYRFLSGKLLAARYHSDASSLWEYLELDAPLALIGERKLGRDLIVDLNPTVVDASYRPRWSAIRTETVGWLEGEAVLAEVERLGVENHPFLESARRVAGEVLAARGEIARRGDASAFATTEAALATMGAVGPGGEGPAVPQSRVVQIGVVASSEALAEPSGAALVRDSRGRLAGEVAGGTIPTRPEPVNFATTLAEAAGLGESEFADEIARIRGLLKVSPFGDVRVTIDDLGWRDALPLVGDPSLVGLPAGRVAQPEILGEGVYFNYVAATRLDDRSPLLEKPGLLRSIAADLVRRNLLRDEANRAREAGLLRF